MRVHRDLSWLAEATGRPGKRRRGEHPEIRGKSAKKAAPRALGFAHLGGGHRHRNGGGKGGPAPPHTPNLPPAHLEGGRGNGGGGRPGGPAGRLPGPGRIRRGEARRGAGQRRARGPADGHRVGVSPPPSPGRWARDPRAGGAGARHWRRRRVMSLSPKPSGGFRPPPAPPTRRETSPHISGGTGRAAAQSGRDSAVRGAGTRPSHAAHPPHARGKPRTRPSNPRALRRACGAGHGADGAAGVLQGGGRGAGCWTPWRCRATRGSCCCS